MANKAVANEIEKLLKEKRQEIFAIAAKYGAGNIRIFGSVARGEADEESDIDFLVDLEEGRVRDPVAVGHAPRVLEGCGAYGATLTRAGRAACDYRATTAPFGAPSSRFARH